jgi:hypothetical protein
MFRAISVLMTIVIMTSTVVPSPASRLGDSRAPYELTGRLESQIAGRVDAAMPSKNPRISSPSLAQDTPWRGRGDCDADARDLQDFRMQFAEELEMLASHEPKIDKAIEQATNGAVKKTNSGAFQRFFKKFWDRVSEKMAQKGFRRRLIGTGVVTVLTSILTVYDKLDTHHEINLQIDLIAGGVSPGDAQEQANLISDVFIDAQIAETPTLLQFIPQLLHFLELYNEQRPCLAPNHPPKSRIPHRQGPNPPRNGGGSGGDGPGVAFGYGDGPCFYIDPTGKIIPCIGS